MARLVLQPFSAAIDRVRDSAVRNFDRFGEATFVRFGATARDRDRVRVGLLIRLCCLLVRPVLARDFLAIVHLVPIDSDVGIPVEFLDRHVDASTPQLFVRTESLE